MDDGMRPRLSAGARVTYDGQGWVVAELTPPSVLLAGPAGGLRRVSISHLLAAPGTRIGDSSGAERPAGAGLRLASLSRALAELRERVAHVRAACTGYRRGSPDLALPGEPRPEYAPGTGRLERYQAKAAGDRRPPGRALRAARGDAARWAIQQRTIRVQVREMAAPAQRRAAEPCRCRRGPRAGRRAP